MVFEKVSLIPTTIQSTFEPPVLTMTPVLRASTLSRTPLLQFVAYECGLCRDELVDIMNKNSLFKLQAGRT